MLIPASEGRKGAAGAPTVGGYRVGSMETQNSAPSPKARRTGRPFSQMTGRQKAVFIVKLALCIVTFGMAFPNVMSD